MIDTALRHVSYPRMLRLWRLLRLLRTGEPVALKGLARELGVTKSLLAGDLAVLSDMGCLFEEFLGEVRLVDEHVSADSGESGALRAEWAALALFAPRTRLEDLRRLAAWLAEGAELAAMAA